MTASTNPPKIKTLRRQFSAIHGAIWRDVAKLGNSAAAAFAWLQSHVDGWRFDVEQLAAWIGVSTRTVYRAIGELEAAMFLRRDPDVWTLLPAIATSDTSVTPRDRDRRAGAPARSHQEKNQDHTYTEERSNVVGSTDGREVGVSKADNQQNRTPTSEPDPPQPVKAKPTHAPDHHDRDLASCADRMRIDAFLRAWSAEFRDGPSALTLMVLPSAWQQRILWLWQYWTADELREAFVATRDAVPRNAWKYFCACLERIAAGDWHPSGPSPHAMGVDPRRTEHGPRVADELRDEVEAATTSTRTIADLARIVADERGIDPAAWSTEERGECITEALRRQGGAQ